MDSDVAGMSVTTSVVEVRSCGGALEPQKLTRGSPGGRDGKGMNGMPIIGKPVGTPGVKPFGDIPGKLGG